MCQTARFAADSSHAHLPLLPFEFIAASSHWSGLAVTWPSHSTSPPSECSAGFSHGSGSEGERERVQTNISLPLPPALWLEMFSSSEASCLEHILNTALCTVNSCSLFAWGTQHDVLVSDSPGYYISWGNDEASSRTWMRGCLLVARVCCASVFRV